MRNGGRERIIYSYQNAFHGVAARLTEEEARVLEQADGVLAIFPETKYQLHTTRSPSFLGLEPAESNSVRFEQIGDHDVVFGVLNTGIWPERESFNDAGLTPVPLSWKGACETGRGFTKNQCNKKVVGARAFYHGNEAATGKINEQNEYKSPRDQDGHGTHSAATVAGAPVHGANLLGYAYGTARGMAPNARIAAYKVCWSGSCFNSDILSAVDKAVADGVNVLSISLGGGVSSYYRVDEVGGSGFISEIGSGTMDLDGGDAIVGIRESIRVQGIVDSGVSLVPSQYIQPLPNRPSTNSHDGDYGDPKSIPVIDLFGLDSAHKDSIKAAIRSACGEWGAFQVINHGVPTELLEEMRRVGLSFFNECTMADKLTYACDPNSFASEGYGTQMLVSNQTNENPSSSVLDWRDYFDHHTLPLSRRNPSRWPNFPSNYRETVAQYGDRMKVLAQQVLAVISESLGLPSSLIEDTVTAGGDFFQNITFSYYPPCPQPDLTLGLQPHSDIGVLTLLIQDDVGGLQVLDKNENWVTVQPLSTDAIVVILADQLEILSNGKCRSCEHRAVTNARKARLSVAAFHDPAKGVKISPASELVGESSPPRYRDIVYGEYSSSWYTKGPEGKRQLDGLRLN